MDLERIIAACGGKRELRERLDISRAALADWIRNGRIPASRLNQISAATGIPLGELAHLASPPRRKSDQ